MLEKGTVKRVLGSKRVVAKKLSLRGLKCRRGQGAKEVRNERKIAGKWVKYKSSCHPRKHLKIELKVKWRWWERLTPYKLNNKPRNKKKELLGDVVFAGFIAKLVVSSTT